MWFKKNKKEETASNSTPKDDSMSKIIDEVLNEQAEAKENAMRQSAEETVQTSNSQNIPNLIEAFHANKNNETYKTVLDAVLPSILLIPAVPAPADENDDEKTIRVTPAFVQNQNGEKLFPAFSDKSQIPESYNNKFKTISMPFGAACELTSKIPDCDNFIVNPFTKPFLIKKDIVENVAKASEQQRSKNSQTVEFSTPEPETRAEAEKITEWFKQQSEIKGAYFSKMKNQERVSYVFILDCPDEVQKEVFERAIEYFNTEKITLPIALMPYNKMEKVVNESKHIEKVY